jgi:hypothetical protein
MMVTVISEATQDWDGWAVRLFHGKVRLQTKLAVSGPAATNLGSI